MIWHVLSTNSYLIPQTPKRRIVHSFPLRPSLSNPTRILLTNREKEILSSISFGFSTDEIADTLFLSAETIRSHRKSLLQKFGARNTAQLIRMAFETGALKLRK